MSEAASEWKGALMRPSGTISVASFVVGLWMAFLAIINIVFGAYSNGRRVNWVDFLTNGDQTNSVHEFTVSFPDDILFILLSSFFIAAGVFGIGSSKEDGFRGWFFGLPRDSMITSLFSSQGGLGRTVASWMIVVGTGYYLVWSTLETTWVDPGVYSVMISFVMAGIGLNWIQDAKLEN